MSDGGGNGLHDFAKDGDLFIRVPGGCGRLVLQYEQHAANSPNLSPRPVAGEAEKPPDILPSPKMEPAELRKLRNILARLYPAPASIDRIVSDAGMDPARISKLNESPDNSWHQVLREAENVGRIDALLGIVDEEYGVNEEFKQFYDKYRQHFP